MSIRNKIIISFFISAFIIAILAAFEYVNFIQVRGELRFLEVTDTIRTKALQLRRHEKNFFLYPAKSEEELLTIHDYLNQLKEITEGLNPDNSAALRQAVLRYGEHFSTIEHLIYDISGEFKAMKTGFLHMSNIIPLIEANFRDRPKYVSDFLQSAYSLQRDNALLIRLNKLDHEISNLRKTGEDMIGISKSLDKRARAEAERGIAISQTALLAVFPIFLIMGLGTLIYISSDVVRRLNTLTRAMDKTGMRYIHSQPDEIEEHPQTDEVDTLIWKFKKMDSQLGLWEDELYEKNNELLKSKKLALVGTMASGVAHELNNPLNNISISAQVLRKQMGDSAPPEIKEIVYDIVGQTARVKGIVGNLLEFAREREPQLRPVELNSLVTRAYSHVNKAMQPPDIRFELDSPPEGIALLADHDQIERVFVNLFTNAIDAMEGKGSLVVKTSVLNDLIKIWVSDTGKGISEEDRDKVFDPFFSKREKGTGLGLAIVMNIIRKHGGDIIVVSEEDEGTAFRITLPRRD